LFLIKYLFFTKMRHPEVRWSIVSSCCLPNQQLLSVSSLQHFIFAIVCTDCLVLSSHYCTLCFFLNVSKFWPSICLFIIHQLYVYVTWEMPMYLLPSPSFFCLLCYSVLYLSCSSLQLLSGGIELSVKWLS